ncbi:SDR family NAD(P)-dependent oxidoreductase [Fulvivirgaceae bacterium BMA10]|uniref:SDR family NAD(P)-dependent oxidoreductase n=1 Tax=Splendidivirga corallicola TaxID=3051826 RepID=A0ABT8KTP9_9BACT|nr:SDR family NAD(P)-dependent oxidoreductase [Fulvivirgaceae bacterium BMA10]
MNLSNKKVLITGGSSGIGLAFAKALSKEVKKVIICGRSEEKLNNVKAENPQLDIIRCDVSDRNDVERLHQTMTDQHPDLNMLINNAGVFQFYSFEKRNHTFEALEKEIEIDFVAPMRLIDKFLPDFMSKEEAAIVNVTSGLAFVPFSMAPVYCATKAGLHSYTESLREQLKNTNVSIYEMCPPLVDTPMTEKMPEAKGFKKENAEELASIFVKGLRNNKLEMRPKASSQLFTLRRFMSGKSVSMINKGNADMEYLYNES